MSYLLNHRGTEVTEIFRYFLYVLCVLAVQILLSAMPVSAQDRSVLHVPGDYATIGEALEVAHEGTLIQLAPGEYTESLVIDGPVALRGARGGQTTLIGTPDDPVIYVSNTRSVRIEGLTIRGGQYGVLVFRSHDVTLVSNVITDNRLVGVKVRVGAADIFNNTIAHTQPPYGRGIHITNTTGWPASHIIGNLIMDNAYMGIGTNMAGRVVIADNIVIGNGQRGIAVVEMSDALVANNTVEDNGGNGIYISDRSMVTACNNTVVNSLPSIEGSGRYGNGITIDFGSEVELYHNTVTGNANHGISVMDASYVTLGDNNVRDNGVDALWLDNTSRTIGRVMADDSCS